MWVRESEWEASKDVTNVFTSQESQPWADHIIFIASTQSTSRYVADAEGPTGSVPSLGWDRISRSPLSFEIQRLLTDDRLVRSLHLCVDRTIRSLHRALHISTFKRPTHSVHSFVCGPNQSVRTQSHAHFNIHMTDWFGRFIEGGPNHPVLIQSRAHFIRGDRLVRSLPLGTTEPVGPYRISLNLFPFNPKLVQFNPFKFHCSSKASYQRIYHSHV